MAKKHLKVTVDYWFLHDLANHIFDPNNPRGFLRLCSGKLQNGPDPKLGTPMHCGLGELYFAMTGHQPDDDMVNEDDVIDMAVELSTLETDTKKLRRQAGEDIEAMDISAQAKSDLLWKLDKMSDDDFRSNAEEEFRQALDAIQSVNDRVADSCYTSDSCRRSTYEQYRSRARRVATQLRKAASILP